MTFAALGHVATVLNGRAGLAIARASNHNQATAPRDGSTGSLRVADPTNHIVLLRSAAFCHDIIVDTDDCIELPPDASALNVEQLVCVTAAAYALAQVRRAEIRLGDSVLVTGDSPLALLTLQWAKLQGAVPLLFAHNGTPSLADTALALGADVVIDSEHHGAAARSIANRGVHVLFHCGDSLATLGRCLDCIVGRGKLVVMGDTRPEPIALNLYPDLHRREVELVGANLSDSWGCDSETCRSLVESTVRFMRLGRVKTDEIVGGVTCSESIRQGQLNTEFVPSHRGWIIDWMAGDRAAQ